MVFRLFILIFVLAAAAFSQVPPIEPGVSQELAKWRAARYSDVRYKLNLTLEKMSPVLKGTIEIRVKLSEPPASAGRTNSASGSTPIILDWRKIPGHENDSTLSNVSINGQDLVLNQHSGPDFWNAVYSLVNEHLIIRQGIKFGENVIKLDFTSPILTSGSAITRYVDKEDGAEYIYSLFVPSDASTAFPVFDQPDLKARFTLDVNGPKDWGVVSNGRLTGVNHLVSFSTPPEEYRIEHFFVETKPISTYVFALAAGPFNQFDQRERKDIIDEILREKGGLVELDYSHPKYITESEIKSRGITIYVRKSQAAKFKPHAAEVFRLNREGIKYLETYFDYKFPFPKYDMVLIPEFPFGGMEHAGATFLRESAIIFPQEPTKNDHISRANLIFHEAAHQWFGDTVTMKWFDDLWLKEGFATFMAYKAMERIMPEMNAWKVFYERVKQAAYQTDSTRGTTPIYQEIKNLSAAKSAYGNIVYNKAPAFLRQAEFYLGEDKFQTAVRAILKKHEYANAGWEDLTREFEAASGEDLKEWANQWVNQRGMFVFHITRHDDWRNHYEPKKKAPPLIAITPVSIPDDGGRRTVRTKFVLRYPNNSIDVLEEELWRSDTIAGRTIAFRQGQRPLFVFPNYEDYGYGIFLLDDKSRDYVLKNIGREKDVFLRSMMWGSLWDSVREGELDPKEYVELVIRALSPGFSRPPAGKKPPEGGTQNEDESTTASLLGRTGTALNYYMSEPPASAGGLTQKSGGKPAFPTASDELRARVENMLIERMRNAPSLGQRITYYRAFLNAASSEKARGVLKGMLATVGNLSGSEGAPRSISSTESTLPTGRVSASGASIPLKSKDRFDIVSRLLILGDPDAPKLLADLEKTETSDDARRYAYAARAGFATAENKAKYWNDFVNNKDISESWIEAAFGPWNSIRHNELTLPYLQRALKELPNHKRRRKIFFVNGWLAAFIGGQRSEAALAVVNKFLADNPNLDNDLRLKILENADLIERAVRIRARYGKGQPQRTQR